MEGPDQPDPGTRDLLDRLASGASKPTEIVVGRDSEAIEAYVRRRLAAAISSGRLNARPVRVDAVATAITRAIDERELEFLFARLAVHEVIARPELLDPEHEGELTRLLAGTHRQLFAAAVDRLGTVAPVNRVLLEALAFGLGRGLPTIGDIWTTVAEAVSLEATGDASETQGLFTDHRSRIDRLMHDAAPYLMMDTEDEQTVYRLAHRTFQEHFLGLRPQQPHRVARVHERVTALLIDAAPANADRPLNPYLLRHLSGHAARSGLPGWLRLAARPDLLDRLDQRALAADAWSGEFGLPSLPAEIAGVIGAGHILAAADAADRRGLRRLAAARTTAQELPADPECTTAAWSVVSAGLRRQHLHRTLTGHTGWVLALATVAVGRRVLLASAGHDRTVRLWDPATATQVGAPMTGHTGRVEALATVDVAGRELLASAGADATVRLWDPATAAPVGAPMTGHTDWVEALATVDVAGRELLASAGADATVRLWDPATARLVHG